MTYEAGKDQYLTYYLIAAYPGSSDREMKQLKDFVTNKLHLTPEQVQVFTPTPSTYASVMYYTEKDPFTGEPIYVEKNIVQKIAQKEMVSKPTTKPTHKTEFATRPKFKVGYAKKRTSQRRHQ
jgi:radical SAM superfamily enzyme YgiQ (UPF0313 family)